MTPLKILANCANNPWTVVGVSVLAAIWFLNNKAIFPDDLEPWTVAEATVTHEQMQVYVDKQVEPMVNEIQLIGADMADRNIPWALKELKSITNGARSAYSLQQLHGYLCGTMEREGQYRRYERLNGTKHFSEGNYCGA